MPRIPSVEVPAHACDAHGHVFGPLADYPTTLPPRYSLPDAPLSVYQAMHDRVGIPRGVLVLPAPYAGAPQIMLDAIRASGGRLRGIGLAHADVDDATLDAWHTGGIRGLRFVDMRDGSGATFAGSISSRCLPELAPRMMERGWHAEIWGPLTTNAALLGEAGIPDGLPIVFDHMAGIAPSQRDDDVDFGRIVSAAREGRVWVKLTLCRTVTSGTDYSAARPFHDRLVHAAPSQLVWGSDFPFVRKEHDAPDIADLLKTQASWIGSADIFNAILADNPQRLYGFTG